MKTLMIFLALLFATPVFADDKKCPALPEVLKQRLMQAAPAFYLTRGIAETACASAGLCAGAVELRPDLQAFKVECLPAEELEALIKDIMVSLGTGS